MTWTQPICRVDYARLHPDRAPTVLKEPEVEVCCMCGNHTASGIYVRIDPHSVPFPREENV